MRATFPFFVVVLLFSVCFGSAAGGAAGGASDTVASEQTLRRYADLERLANAGKIVADIGTPYAPFPVKGRLAPQSPENKAALDEIAGGLRSPDLFVRALAHAAAAQIVGHANNGDTTQITAGDAAKPDAPAWLREYARASASHDALVEFDWVRHLVLEGKFFDAPALTGELQTLAKRTTAISSLSPRSPLPAPRSLPALRQQWLDARRALRPAVLAAAGLTGSGAPQLLLFTRHGYHHKPNVCGAHTSWGYKPGGELLALDAATGTTAPLLRGRLPAGHFHGFDISFDARRIVFAYAEQPHWPPPARYGTAWPGPPRSGQRENACFAHELRELGTQPPPHLWELALAPASQDSSRAGGVHATALPPHSLTLLTNHPYWSDTEPAYLPGGGVVFASDRSAHSPSCDSPNNDLTDLNLYALTPDHRRVRRLLNHKDIDTHPRVLANGLIAYLRWEYQERYFMETHSVWTVRADGTGADSLFKQHNIPRPYSVRLATSLGNTGKLLAIATGHHALPQGVLVVLDPATGGNNPAGVRVLTTGLRINEGDVPGATVPEGGRADPLGFYTDPTALTDTALVASYAFASPTARRYLHEHEDADSNGYGAYLLDLHGNKELLFRDPFLGAYNTRPLRPRKEPPAPPPRDFADDNADPAGNAPNFATCTIPDVQQGMTDAAGAPLPAGTVKYIRIAEALPWPVVPGEGAKRWVNGTWTWLDRDATRWCPVRVIGDIPVEADGSAHFKVPVSDNASVYFQALDANKMEVRRMRSSVSFAPGEQRGCTGCHETREEAAQNLSAPRSTAPSRLAFRRPPSEPLPPPWGARRPVHFATDIAPIFDRRCAGCHDGARPAAGLRLTAATAFRTIRDKKLASISNCQLGSGITAVKQFGSHRSRLTQALVAQNKMQVKLTGDEWHALTLWLDANTPHTGHLLHKRHATGARNRWDTHDWGDPWAPPRTAPALVPTPPAATKTSLAHTSPLPK